MPELSRPIELVEYSCCPEPVRLSPEIARAIRDCLKGYLHIDSAWDAPQSYWLTARQYVGDIIVGDVHIRIRSEKASMVNLLWMLTYAYDLPEFRSEIAFYAKEEGMFEFLVGVFAGQVRRLIRHGIIRNYRARQDNQLRLRGHLNIAQQLRRNLVHPERFAVRWAEHTPDVLENRLLKHVLLQLASVRYPNRPMLSSQLRKAYAAFDLVTYVPVTLHDFDAVKYNRLNQHYLGTLVLARLLWQHLSLRNEPGRVPFATYLFDLNLLFERFIAAYLVESLGDSELEVKHKYRTALDSGKIDQAEMDVVLLQDHHPVLVLDTKYKSYTGSPGRNDRNQIFTYCHTLGVKRGMLLYPSTAHLADRRLMAGVTVEVRGVSLGGSLEQFKSNLTRMGKELAEMVSVDRVPSTE